jgi:hypothetical protein
MMGRPLSATGQGMPNLDITTIFVMSALTYVALAAVMVHYLLTHQTYPGFRDWVFFTVGLAISLLLFIGFPRGRLPHPALLYGANLLLIASVDRLYRGMARFAGKDPAVAPFQLGVYVAGLAAFTWFAYGDQRSELRTAVAAVLVAYPTALAAVAAWRLARDQGRPAGRLLTVAFGFAVAVHLGRALAALRLRDPQDLLPRSGVEVLLNALVVVSAAAMMVGFLILTAERSQAEATEARQRVKQLEGIIPVCMYCRKVRDDREAWLRMETYISAHSSALFSHGICPECMPKHFPEGDGGPAAGVP